MSEVKPNPLLERLRVPGETFRLPSRGLFYHHNELSDDVVDGELQVLPMTTIDELVFKSADKLFSGKAVTEVFSRCIPQVLKPGELLSRDVDFLLMCLRLVSYGEQLPITVTHTCEGAKEHEYKLPVREQLKKAKEIDPVGLDKKFIMELANGQVVKLCPPKYADVIKIYQQQDNADQMTDEKLAETVSNNIASLIENVDGEEDRELIKEWVLAIKAGWVNEIANHVINISAWGIPQTTNIVCKDCNKDIEIQVPTNPITFFT